MKKRKFLYILTVFVLIAVIFCNTLTASALTSYNFVISRPQITNNSCYFEIVNQFGAAYVLYVSVAVDSHGTVPDEVDTEKISVIFDTFMENGNLWVYPRRISALDDGVDYILEGYEIYGTIISQNGSFTNATLTNMSHNPSGESAGISIGSGYICVRAYNANWTSNNESSTVFVYGNEINTNDKLDKIYGAIAGGNDEIKANQDKNADEIKKNQDKNAESIKNGWKSDKEIDKSVSDEHAAKEKEIMDSTSEGRNMSVSLFDDFSSLLNGGQSFISLGEGLLAASAVLTEFDQIKWLNTLITFSLSLGVFAFIIGTVQLVVSKSSSSERYKRSRRKSSKY